MKKAILLGLSLSLMVPTTSKAEDFVKLQAQVYAALMVIAAAGIAVIAGTVVGTRKISDYIQLRRKAKEAGVSVAVYRVGADLLGNREFKTLLQLAAKKKKADLKAGIINLNKQYFGDNWAQKRKQLLNNYTYESESMFTARHSKALYDKIGHYIQLYVALAKLYGAKIEKCESQLYLKTDPDFVRTIAMIQSEGIKWIWTALEKAMVSKDQNPVQQLVLMRGLDRKLAFPEKERVGGSCPEMENQIGFLRSRKEAEAAQRESAEMQRKAAEMERQAAALQEQLR